MNNNGYYIVGGVLGLVLLILAILIVSAGFVVGVVFLILFIFSNSKHKNYAIAHSEAITKLREINKKYQFLKINSFGYRNTYDNEDFYKTISCKDYLIYQLQFKQKDVWKEISKCATNRELFKQYSLEMSEKHVVYGKFTGDISSFKINKLIKYEKEEVKRIILSPTTNFQIRVILIRTLINGRRMESKNRLFSEQEIIDVLNQLKNKRGSFYLNNDIWNSICRVERGKVSNKMRFAIYNRDHNRCRICGSRHNLEVDHIYPIAKGGKSTYDNLQTLCHRCNVKKGTSVY